MMKTFRKYLAGLLVATLIFAPFPASAFLNPGPQPVVYRATVTGLRVSAVDGTAFIDGANASITALADGNHLIEIYDSSNRMIKGVLKAAGTGETYTEGLTGANLNWGTNQADTGNDANDIATFNSNYSRWFLINPLAKDISVAANIFAFTMASGSQAFRTNYTLTNSTLNVLKVNVASKSGTWIISAHDGGYFSLGALTVGANTFYLTKTSTAQIHYYFTNAAGGGALSFNASVVANSNAQVLAPSTSGATIVSAKGGTVQNFSYNGWGAGSYNATSYAVIVRKLR